MNIQDALRTEAPITPELLERATGCLRDLHAILGKLTELGEIADDYKRHIFYGQPLDVANIKVELGDGYWYDAVLHDIHGCTFEECYDIMLAKLRARFPEKFTEHNAINRDLAVEREIVEKGA